MTAPLRTADRLPQRPGRFGDDRDADPCRPAVPASEPCPACLGDGLDLSDENAVAWCKECGGLGEIPREMPEELIHIVDDDDDPGRPESQPWTDADREAFARQEGGLLYLVDDNEPPF